MRNNQIEYALNRAVNEAPLLSFEKLASLPYIKMSEHDDITAPAAKKSPIRVGQLSLAFACCLLIVISISGWFLQHRMKDSVILLDVNPSIEIITNRKDQVLSMKALNTDAEAIIADINYKGENLTQTVDRVIDSLVEHSYLNPYKNALLISIKNKNMQKANQLLTSVNETIRGNLEAQDIRPTILRQVLPMKEDNRKLAKRYHISEGKLKLIQAMIAKNDRYTMEQLAVKSVKSLLEIAKELKVDLSAFLPEGNAEPPSDSLGKQKHTIITPVVLPSPSVNPQPDRKKQDSVKTDGKDKNDKDKPDSIKGKGKDDSKKLERDRENSIEDSSRKETGDGEEKDREDGEDSVSENKDREGRSDEEEDDYYQNRSEDQEHDTYKQSTSDWSKDEDAQSSMYEDNKSYYGSSSESDDSNKENGTEEKDEDE